VKVPQAHPFTCSYDNQPIALDCVAKHRRMNSKYQVFLDYTQLDWSGSPLLPPNASLTFTKLIYCPPVLELCLLYINKHFLKYWILPSTQREPSTFRVQYHLVCFSWTYWLRFRSHWKRFCREKPRPDQLIFS